MCFSAKVRNLLGYRMLHTYVCFPCQVLAISGNPRTRLSVSYFHGYRPWLTTLDFSPLPPEHDARVRPFLPAGGRVRLSTTHNREPASHRCVTHFWLDNAQRTALYGLTLAGDGCQATFMHLAIHYPCHTMLFNCQFAYPRWESNPTAPWLRARFQHQLNSEAWGARGESNPP